MTGVKAPRRPGAPRRSSKAVAASVLTAATLATESIQTASADATHSVPALIATQLQPARLAGEGELRFLGLRIYTARLWVNPEVKDAGLLLQQPLALELRYLRNLQGQTIVEEIRRFVTGEGLRYGVTGEMLATMA
jgi:hypothetical protein